MSQWKKVLIKDLGRIVTGHTPPTKEKKFFGDFMPFIKPTDISKDEKYTYHPEQYYSLEAAEKYKSSLIPKGATCVVCIGTIGEKMTMAHCDLFTNQSINSIIPSDDYDPDFVYYLLKYNLGKVKSLNKGTASGREFVSKSTFLEMPIKVCVDRDEQIRIGSVLSHYDSLIENYQQQIKLLEEAAQRLYKEWFVDLHFPGYENTKIVDGVPEGWEKETLGNIVPILTGKKDANFADVKGKYPFFTCAQDILNAPSYSFDGSAVLLAGNGDFNIKLYRGKFEAYQRTYVLIPKELKYLFLIYNAIATNLDRLSSRAAGSTIKFLTKGMISSIPILIPSALVLKEYNCLSEEIQNKIELLRLQLRLLTEARDRLLPKLMSGEIEV